MMLERGLHVDHTTIYRWVQRYAPELEKRCRSHLKACNDSWKVDETYIKVRKVWMYLYQAIDSEGNTSVVSFNIHRNEISAVPRRIDGTARSNALQHTG
jgi:transposase-like protein